MRHRERHGIGRMGWLRAAVLGANDGIVSTASLLIGVAAAQAARSELLTAGTAGLVAGAMSMAAGEYVSVGSQADSERAALALEQSELAREPELERRELAEIYVRRGLEPLLARRVAEQLMEHDSLEAHSRDELGITDALRARPLQAAFASAGAFALGASLPLLVAWVTRDDVIPAVSGASLVFLAVLGALAARAGGAATGRGATRVVFWGALAMGLTALVGKLFGAMA